MLVKARTYCCPEHVEDWRKTQSSAKPAAKSKKIPTIDSGYADLVAYICEVYETKNPSPLILKQIKQFHQDYSMTYDGMRMTIQYCLLYKDPPLELIPAYGVGFLPSYYEEARQFYSTRLRVQRQLQNVDINKVTNQARVVTIRSEDQAQQTNARKLIEIACIEVDDD